MIQGVQASPSVTLGKQGSSEMLTNHNELKVWQSSYQPCSGIYKITKIFTNKERYGLTSQTIEVEIMLKHSTP